MGSNSLLKKLLRGPIAASRARSSLAYLFDMSRLSLRGFLHSTRSLRFFQQTANSRFSILIFLAVALIASSCATLTQNGPKIGFPEIQGGDSWTYQELNGYNRELKARFRQEVVEANGDTIVLRIVGDQDGSVSTRAFTKEWNFLSHTASDGKKLEYSPPFPAFAFPLEPGKSWKHETFAADAATGKKTAIKVYGKVLGWERVKVPAGEFNAIKIQRQLYLDDHEWWRSGTRILEFDWYAPEVKQIVKHQDDSEYTDKTKGRRSMLVRGDINVLELVAYRVGPP